MQADGGCPREISAWDKNKSVYGRIVRMAGPWRTSGEWWRADRWARDEWDVAVEVQGKGEGGRGKTEMDEYPGAPLQVIYRIYRELKNDTWFVEGIYD